MTMPNFSFLALQNEVIPVDNSMIGCEGIKHMRCRNRCSYRIFTEQEINVWYLVLRMMGIISATYDSKQSTSLQTCMPLYWLIVKRNEKFETPSSTYFSGYRSNWWHRVAIHFILRFIGIPFWSGIFSSNIFNRLRTEFKASSSSTFLLPVITK